MNMVSSIWYAVDGAVLAESLSKAALMLHTKQMFFKSVGTRLGADECGMMPPFFHASVTQPLTLTQGS